MYIHEAETLEQYEADMYPLWEYECREYDVVCDCGMFGFGTQQTLERLGWQLKDVEICPKCAAYLGRRWQ